MATHFPPFASVPSVVLHLRPSVNAVAYRSTLTWEAFANGEYQRSTIEKDVLLRVQPLPMGLALDFQSLPPKLTKPEDLESLEGIALRLAALYERVVVQAMPTGEVVALLNHAALLQTWERLARDLRVSTTDDDQVTKTMLNFLEQQLQSPANFLRSLQHDYLYQTLVPNFYCQRLGDPGAVSRSRQFSNFFDKTSLWFSEHIKVQPDEDEAPEQVTLRVHGTLDAQQTNMAAVQSLIEKALQIVSSPADYSVAPADVPAPHFKYEATYVVALNTGLPLSINLSVYARAGQLYNKEYTLIITRQ